MSVGILRCFTFGFRGDLYRHPTRDVTTSLIPKMHVRLLYQLLTFKPVVCIVKSRTESELFRTNELYYPEFSSTPYVSLIALRPYGLVFLIEYLDKPPTPCSDRMHNLHVF